METSFFKMFAGDSLNLPFLFTTVGICSNQDYISRPNGHPDYHWLHCVQGKGILLVNNNEHIIHEKSGFFFHPGVAHQYYALEEPWETHWITFNGYAVSPLMQLLGLGKCEVFYILDMLKVEKMFDDIYLSAQSSSVFRGYECSYLLYKFIIELRNCLDTDFSTPRYLKYKQLQPVISFMEDNYNMDISLQDMADIMNVTPRHFCRLFKEAFNLSPFKYLIAYRIKKAKELLVLPDNPTIKEVALKTGYNDISYFCKIFKGYEGLTPLEFKRMYRSI
ncbi:MAG TPA: AraC family transcriptional regulator [Clostridiales bacterium]|nr:AraC family transcriptional regulator [Clostridiales bacterium]